MKKIMLITNSDDFGLTNSITDAIIDTHINGIMTSTTIMVNMPGFEYAVRKAKEINSLGVGIHLNLTEGKPVSETGKIPLLVNENGLFKENKVQRKNLLFGKERFRQTKIEIEAQITKLLDSGIHPSHFDSHHHITGVPVAFRASYQLALKFGINSARITNIDYSYAKEATRMFRLKNLPTIIKSFPKSIIHTSNKRLLRSKIFYTPDTKILPSRVLPALLDPVNHFIRVLSVLKPNVTEISFHPGYSKSYKPDSPSFADTRIRDYNIATNPDVINFIKNSEIELINFHRLNNG